MKKCQFIIAVITLLILALVFLAFYINSKVNINRTFYGKTDNWEVNMAFTGNKPLDPLNLEGYKYKIKYCIYFIGDEKEFMNQPLSIKIKYSESGLSSTQADDWDTTKDTKFEWNVGSGSFEYDMLNYFDPNKEINIKAYISMGNVQETFVLKEK